MVATWLGTIMILLPFIGALLLLILAKWKADTTGFVMWLVMFILAITLFKTDAKVSFLASVVGFIKSFPISFMVCTSIFMITYMQKTGALQRIIVAFKRLGGEGKEAFQIMFINIGLGCFLVSIGANPVTMLPPIMIALGYSSLAAVALPAIGYDPLTTFALLAIPAVIFQGEMSGLFSEFSHLFPGLAENFPTLAQSGFTFSLFMPVVTIGIALGMMLIAGGRKLLFNKRSILFASVGGLTTGGTAVLVNFLAKTFEMDGLVPLTGLFAGLVTIGAMMLLAKMLKIKIFDKGNLTEEDIKIEQSMPLWKASLPWLILVVLCSITNFIPQIFDFLFSTLAMPVEITGFAPIKLRVFWNAYLWLLVATILSMPFLGVKGKLKDILSTWSKRSIKPVFAAAIFFSVASVMTSSGATGLLTGEGMWEISPENNMISILATASADIFGKYYPLIVPFVGLLGGFVSGSETSSIAMFTGFHFKTGNSLGMSSSNILVMGASNGIGGGLASVLSPAKIQSATAVIDKQGLEGEVIKKTAPIALLMVTVVSVITLCWANEYSVGGWFAVIGIALGILALIVLAIFGFSKLRKKRLSKDAKLEKEEES
ncbi:MAG: L-lactate permease [Candidatus Heimdallarchaeota archaeon]